MNLFDLPSNPAKNLLPQDGIVNYYGRVMSIDQSLNFFKVLMNNIEWKNDEAVMYGKHIITKRKVAWYGSQPFSYSYSKIVRNALPWTRALMDLKELTEEKTGETFNSCLLNLYHSGEEGMSWHTDDEKELKPNGVIASLSFGAERKFAFKHKTTKEKVEVHLESGSLLLMKGSTQSHWLHSLPKTKKVTEPRINLTFRTIVH